MPGVYRLHWQEHEPLEMREGAIVIRKDFAWHWLKHDGLNRRYGDAATFQSFSRQTNILTCTHVETRSP
jgi:hypothetical protein